MNFLKIVTIVVVYVFLKITIEIIEKVRAPDTFYISN